MKRTTLLLAAMATCAYAVNAQDLKSRNVPAIVKETLAKKYPHAAKVSWEKEKGNYEANWGGRSGEDTSVLFTPKGAFVEEVDAIPVSQLPANIPHFVKAYYKSAKINEAGKVTDAAGKKMFEAEIKGKDLLFDESGKFIKQD